MDLEVVCEQLLQSILVLHSKNNPELALLYFRAVLHTAERDKLSVEWIDKLIATLPRIINLLAMDKQIALYERLLKLAESKKLTSQIARLHQALGEIHEKRVTQTVRPTALRTTTSKPERYHNHITALANFVKARAMLSQSVTESTNSEIVNNQRSISRVEIVCHFDLLLGHYKSELLEAKSKKQVDVVAVLQHFLELAVRLQSAGLLIEAISVYQQAFDQLSTQQSFYEKTCLKDVDETFLLKGLLQLSETNPNLTVSQPLWQQNLNQLRELRETFKKRINELYKAIDSIRYDVNQIQQLEQLQSDLTFVMKEFIVVLFKQAETLLGPAPYNYSILGMGSIARGDMTPYSDLESVLLVEQDISKNSAARNYFETLLRLVEFQVHSLGESFDDNPGFHLDKECHPLIMAELIGTPEQLLQRFKLTDLSGISTDQDGNGLLAYTLLRPTLVHGSSSLFDKYQALANQAQRQHTETRQANAREFVRVHVKTFQEETRKSFDESDQFKKTCQVKKNLLGPLTHLLTDLAFHHHLAGVNLVDILSELSEQKVLNAEFAQTCRGALAELNLLRLNAHLLSDQQNDVLMGASALQIVRLQFIFNGICAALYYQPDRLLVSVNKPYHPVMNSLSEMTIASTTTVEIEQTTALSVNPANTITHRARSNASAGTPIPMSKMQKNSMLFNAASYLLYCQQPTDVDALLMCEAYQALHISLRPELLKQFAAVEIWLLGNQFKTRALKQLAYQPNADGWYPAMEEERNQWLKVFSALFQMNATAEMIQLAKQTNAVVVGCGNLRGGMGVSEYLLHDAARAQLFEPNGQPKAKPNNQRGRHTVLKVTHQGQIFWFKFTPEQAGTEYAVNRLARHIGDQGTPMSTVLKISMGNNVEGIAVQVAPHVEGLTLEETLQKHPERLSQLDSGSFTETLLRVLLTNPEDDKGDDYFLPPDENKKDSFRLKRIDNERAFYDPTELKGILKKNEALQVKSMLYCLPQMQMPLSQEALNKFLILDPILVLQHWLNELQAEHQRYQGLFTDKDIETHFGIKEPGPCLLGIPIAGGLIEELLTRLDSMQQVVRLAKEQGRAVIGMDLLKVVQPMLADFYADAFKAIPDLKPEAVFQRFDFLTKNLYQRSKQGVRESRIQSAKAITQSLRLKTKLSSDVVLQMVHGKQNSPAQGLETLRNLQSKKLEDIKRGLLIDDLKVNKAAVTQFQNLVVRHRLELFKELIQQHEQNPLTANQQITLLAACVGVPFHELSLQDFSEVLTDKLLQPILEGAGAHLIKLDLRDCCLLTDKSIQRIVELCPNLAYLHLKSSMSNEQTKGKDKLRTLKGVFPKLSMLDIHDCVDLVAIDIDAPQLSVLRAKNCRQLQSIKTQSLLLKEVDVMGCKVLEDAGIIELCVFVGHLQQVMLEQSGIKQRKFRECYPYLIMLPLGYCSDLLVKNINKWLQEGFAKHFAKLVDKNLLFDSRSASQLFDKLIARLSSADQILKIVNELIKTLDIQSQNIARKLLGFIVALGYKTEKIIQIFTPLLNDSNSDVRAVAATALGQAALHIPLPTEIIAALTPLLKGELSDVRAAVTTALGQAALHIALPTEVIATLISMLKDYDFNVRETAGVALGQVAIHNFTEVIAAFILLMKDSNRDIRVAATTAVWHAGIYIAFPAEIIATLALLLRDQDSSVRAVAVAALGRASLQAVFPLEIVEAVISLLKDPDSDVIEATIKALGKAPICRVLPEEVIMVLTHLLKDRHSHIRAEAAVSLGNIASGKTLPANVFIVLAVLLDDEYPIARESAAKILDQIAVNIVLPEQSIVKLIDQLNDNNNAVVREAVIVLGWIMTTHTLLSVAALSQVLFKFIALTENGHGEVRQSAVTALGRAAMRIALPAEAITALKKILTLKTDRNSYLKKSCTAALGKAVIHKSIEVIEELTSFLQGYVAEQEVAAALGHAAIYKPTEVIRALAPLLNNSEADIRALAARAVGASAIHIALPTDIILTLKRLLRDEYGYVRQQASIALGHAALNVVLPSEILAELGSLLGSSNSNCLLRSATVTSFKQIATKIALPTDILTALTSLLRYDGSSDSEDVSLALGQAALKIALPSETVAELIVLLKGSDSDVRKATALALENAILHNFTEVVNAALTLLKNEDSDVRAIGVKVIGQAAIHNPMRIVAVLSPLLKLTVKEDRFGYIRDAATIALSQSLSEIAFRKDIESVMRDAKLIPANNLSVRASVQQNSSNNKLNTSSSSSSAGTPFWNQELAATTSLSSSSSSTSSGLTSNMTTKR